MIAGYASTDQPTARQMLLSAWEQFDPVDYARVVLTRMSLDQGPLTITSPYVIPGLASLRSLTKLICLFHAGFGSIDFVRQLPAVANLAMLDPQLTDLMPISQTGVQHLSLLGHVDSDIGQVHADAIDLGPLAMSRQLVSVRSERATVNWRSLCELPQLAALDLTWAHESNLIGDLARLAHLKAFAMRSVTNLSDLTELLFLTAPSDLNLSNWAALTSLAQLERWSGSLRQLSLSHCGQIDLTTMPALPALTKLDLAGSNVQDLRPLLWLRGLRSLRLDGNQYLRDLRPLSELPNLKELSLVGCHTANIWSISGHEGLQVSLAEGEVDTLARLQGADRKIRPMSQDMCSRQDWLRAGPWDWRYEYMFRTSRRSN